MSTEPIIIIGGEPFSIFSEILFKCIKSSFKSKKPLILIGSLKLFKAQMNKLGFKIKFNQINENFKHKDLKLNKTINIIDVNFIFSKCFSSISSKSQNYIENCFSIGLKIAKRTKISGLINGPISKPNFFIKDKYPGITEYLSYKTNTKKVVMLIYNKNFSVTPLTTHIPLKYVHKFIDKKKIFNCVKILKQFYKIKFKKDPLILITGLNPHCESSDKNNEEKKIIIPAIKILKKKFRNIDGPFSADSLFMKKNLNKFDVVIGMYHDQVLTPAKTIHNFKAINITLGLPFIRISPDHGPNNQMIGKNISNHESLLEAIKFLN